MRPFSGSAFGLLTKMVVTELRGDEALLRSKAGCLVSRSNEMARATLSDPQDIGTACDLLRQFPKAGDHPDLEKLPSISCLFRCHFSQ